MELYVFAESGEFLGVIDLLSSLRWRRRYWEPGEVELHLYATEENIALLQPGVILRRVDRKESARVMGIDIKGYELTVSARMLSIYFGMALVIGLKSYTGTPAEILCQLAEDARDSVPELVVDRADLPTGDAITIQLDFKNTLKAMTAVAKAYGLGFRLLYSTEQKFTFQVYEGADHSAEQTDNPVVYFTDEFQNFIDAETYDLCLYYVRVPAGATAITSSMITDKRADSDLCGYVYCKFKGIDLTVMQKQYETWFSELSDTALADQEAFESEFAKWFAHMKDQLTEDAAGNLQLQIDKQQEQIDAILREDVRKEGFVGHCYNGFTHCQPT